MLQVKEKWLYTILIVYLTIFAIFFPFMIIQKINENRAIYSDISRFTAEDIKKCKCNLRNKISSNKTDTNNKHEDVTLVIPSSFSLKYHDLAKLDDYLTEFVNTHKILVTKKFILEDKYSRGIYEIILAEKRLKKPKILIMSGLRAKDWSSILTTIQIMRNFIFGKFRISHLLNSYDFHFLPLMCREGYNYSRNLPIYQTNKSSILNSFKNDKRTSESVEFMKYFRKSKSDIKAIFFLFSPEVINFKNGIYTISNLQGNTSLTENILNNLTKSLQEKRNLHFKYSNNKKFPEGSIQQWVTNETQPNPILLINLMSFYGIHPPLVLDVKIKELASDAYFLITNILDKLGTQL